MFDYVGGHLLCTEHQAISCYSIFYKELLYSTPFSGHKHLTLHTFCSRNLK